MPTDRKPVGPKKRNIKLTIEYDGTDFSGWQRQRGCRTVQECVEGAIAEVTGEKVGVLASGRTDAGVHAEGQVACFRTASALGAGRLPGAINSYLDSDAAVLSAEEVPAGFHPIRDAKGKLYRYRISTRRVRPVIDRRRVCWVKAKLNAAAMREACGHLVGTHDFNSFRAEGGVDKDTVRTIESIELEETPGEIALFFRGKGFLYMMVRIMVGTLIEVGRGRTKPGEIPAAIAARDRGAAGPTAEPAGLCLVEVYY